MSIVIVVVSTCDIQVYESHFIFDYFRGVGLRSRQVKNKIGRSVFILFSRWF